jgi:hypothetical protein
LWTNSFTATAFANTDTPPSGIQLRQNVIFGSAGCKLPLDIPGITASGTNEIDGFGFYTAKIQSIKTTTNLGREALYQLGQRGPYHRYVNFPVQVTSDFEVLSLTGDSVQALEAPATNTTNQTINIHTMDGTIVDLGTKNRLSSVTYGGGNAGQNGGNDTMTFSYLTFNDMTVTSPGDPSGL